jgi:D-arabinose 5-phosphate isomerase GutQ
VEKSNEQIVCKSVWNINRVNRNLGEIDEKILGKTGQTIKECRRIILSAEGRSESGLLIGLNGIKKRTFAQGDSSFRWNNITEAATDLNKKRGTTVLLINSQSGDTTSPKEMAKDLRAFINKTGSKKFVICCVTAHPESEIAKNSDIVLQLKGSEEGKEKEGKGNQGSSGIEEMMGDVFELGSTLLFYGIKKGVNNGLGPKKILALLRKEMKIIGNLIDNYLKTNHYREIVDEVASKIKIVFGGKGPDQEVANMTAIRTKHVVNMLGREAYIAGPLAPAPQPGVLIVLISWSGETKSVLDWRDKYNKGGANVFSIVGTTHSSLTEKTRNYVLEAPKEKFYFRVAFLLSPLPGGVMEKLKRCKIQIPIEMLRTLGHSRTE